MQLVAAVGEQQQQGRRLHVVDQEAEQVKGRLVGPVQVLDDQDRRGPGGQALQQRQHGLEQAGLRRRVGAEPAWCPASRRLGGHLPEVGDQAREQGPPRPEQLVEGGRLPVPAEPAQRLGHRGEGQGALAELDAAAQQHLAAALARPRGELTGQPGLADPGLAAEAHGQGLAGAGAGERRFEAGQLGAAANEARAGDAAGHAREYGPEPARPERLAGALPHQPTTTLPCMEGWIEQW